MHDAHKKFVHCLVWDSETEVDLFSHTFRHLTAKTPKMIVSNPKILEDNECEGF